MKKQMNIGQSAVSWVIGISLVVVVVLLGYTFLIGNQEEILPQGGAPPEIQPQSSNVTVRDVVTDPTQYYGSTITLDGEVDRIYNSRAFLLDQELTVIGDEILVITSSKLPDVTNTPEINPYVDGDDVQVAGTVRQFIIPEVESEIGMDLDQEFEIEFNERPVIYASDVILKQQNTM